MKEKKDNRKTKDDYGLKSRTSSFRMFVCFNLYAPGENAIGANSIVFDKKQKQK